MKKLLVLHRALVVMFIDVPVTILTTIIVVASATIVAIFSVKDSEASGDSDPVGGVLHHVPTAIRKEVPLNK